VIRISSLRGYARVPFVYEPSVIKDFCLFVGFGPELPEYSCLLVPPMLSLVADAVHRSPSPAAAAAYSCCFCYYYYSG